MLRTPVGRLRVIGLIEGLSFLFLLGIAMPLKYFADIPQVVTVIGMVHGVLFMLYLVAVAHATIVVRWSAVWTIGAVIASVIPFGNFVLDKRLRQIQ
jgi:integral membrane protein